MLKAIYTTEGDPKAFLEYPNLFNEAGEWVGFVTPQRDVYSVSGIYVGVLTDDPRIIRRKFEEPKPQLTPPEKPASIRIPAVIPLPGMMRDLPLGNIDILQEEPYRLHTVDMIDYRKDFD